MADTDTAEMERLRALIAANPQAPYLWQDLATTLAPLLLSRLRTLEAALHEIEDDCRRHRRPGMSAPLTTLAKARALIKAAEKATSGPWATLPSPDTDDLHGKIVSPKGDAELGNWLVADGVRWAENRAFIAAARNDVPDIARALVEAMELLREAERFVQNTPWSMRGDNMLADLRAFLAKHDG